MCVAMVFRVLLCSCYGIVSIFMCCYGVVSVLSVAVKLPGHCFVLLCGC